MYNTEKELRMVRWKSEMKLLRILISPYRNWKIKRSYNAYLKSGNVEKLRQLRATHTGERCFIIGNGPSLCAEDLDRLKGEFTFAFNRIYDILDQTTWRPTVYMAVDGDFLQTNLQDILRVPCKLRVVPWFAHETTQSQSQNDLIETWREWKEYKIDVVPFWAEKTAEIPEDISLGFSEGRTVTFDAIQLAIYMGFHEIYLLGVDFNYSKVLDEDGQYHKVDGVDDYFSQKSYDTTRLLIVPTKYAYTVAREYCDGHGIIIRNATRGGKLEVFERVDFDTLIL